MKDLFYNYDHYQPQVLEDTKLVYETPHKILASDSTVKIVSDLKGNELGVQVKHNNAFTLYFSMEDLAKRQDFETLISTGTFIFEILTTLHDVVIHKELVPNDNLIVALNTVAVSISDTEAKELDIDSYRMKLTLICDIIDDEIDTPVTYKEISYELYSEETGLLIVR